MVYIRVIDTVRIGYFITRMIFVLLKGCLHGTVRYGNGKIVQIPGAKYDTETITETIPGVYHSLLQMICTPALTLALILILVLSPTVNPARENLERKGSGFNPSRTGLPPRSYTTNLQDPVGCIFEPR